MLEVSGAGIFTPGRGGSGLPVAELECCDSAGWFFAASITAFDSALSLAISLLAGSGELHPASIATVIKPIAANRVGLIEAQVPASGLRSN